jgi:anti-sigma regulatory factor (Ser/Thr protein kinase)
VIVARSRPVSVPARHRVCALENSLRAPREAREFCRAVLEAWGLADEAELVTLLVSELVTNSVRYTAGGIELRLSMPDDRLLVEIHDQECELPVQRAAGSADERGRGLLLVQQLSSRWGARPDQDGKVVWFEVPVPDQTREHQDA